MWVMKQMLIFFMIMIYECSVEQELDDTISMEFSYVFQRCKDGEVTTKPLLALEYLTTGPQQDHRAHSQDKSVPQPTG